MPGILECDLYNSQKLPRFPFTRKHPLFLKESRPFLSYACRDLTVSQVLTNKVIGRGLRGRNSAARLPLKAMLSVVGQKLPLRLPKRTDIDHRRNTPSGKNTRWTSRRYHKIAGIAKTDIAVPE